MDERLKKLLAALESGELSQDDREFFFRPSAPPNRTQTELFTRKVMERIEADEWARVPAWLSPRWLIPALSAGLAVFFLSIFVPRRDASEPMDALFLSAPQAREAGQAALPAEDIFGIALEGK